MMNEWILRVLGALAFIFGAAACGLYTFVLHDVRSRLPPQFSGQFTAPIVLNEFVWDRSTPPAEQHKYLMSKVCGVVFAGCVVLLVVGGWGAVWPSLVFGLVFASAVADLLSTWRRYRAQQ
jgi:TctA family transporter